MERIGLKQNNMNKVNHIMKFSAFVNFFLSLFKIIIGIIGKSGALLADGIHSFSDLITDFIAIFGSYFSDKPADDEHPYGHGRIEYITSCGIGMVVILIGLTLIYNCVNTKVIIPSYIVIIVSIITVISKYILSSYLIKKGNVLNNNILISSGKESRADVYSSVVVLLSSILIQFSNSITILKYSDKIATIIVGIFIIRTGFMILRENTSILIGKQEENEIYSKPIKEFILSEEDIYSLDDFVMLKYGSYYKIIMEVGMDSTLSLESAHSKAHDLENKIKNRFEFAKYITIHINPIKKSAKKK